MGGETAAGEQVIFNRPVAAFRCPVAVLSQSFRCPFSAFRCPFSAFRCPFAVFRCVSIVPVAWVFSTVCCVSTVLGDILLCCGRSAVLWRIVLDDELLARLPPVGPLTLRTCEGTKPEL